MDNNQPISEAVRPILAKAYTELEALDTDTNGPEGQEYGLAINEVVMNLFDNLLDFMASLKGITFDAQQAEFVKSRTSNCVRFLATRSGVKDLHLPFRCVGDYVIVDFLDVKGRVTWCDNSTGEADVLVTPLNEKEDPFTLRRVSTLLLRKM